MELIKSSPSNSISSSTTGASSSWNFPNWITTFTSEPWTLPKVLLVTGVTLSIGFGFYYLYTKIITKGGVLTPENKEVLRAQQDIFIRERGSAMSEHFQRNRNNSEILEEIPVIAETPSPVLEENSGEERKWSESPVLEGEELPLFESRERGNSSLLEKFMTDNGQQFGLLTEEDLRNYYEAIETLERSTSEEEKALLLEIKKKALDFQFPEFRLTSISRIPSDPGAPIYFPERLIKRSLNREVEYIKNQVLENSDYQNAISIYRLERRYEEVTITLNQTIQKIELKNRKILNLRNDSQDEKTAEISNDSLDEQTAEIATEDLKEWSFNAVTYHSVRNAMAFCMNYADLILEFFK